MRRARAAESVIWCAACAALHTLIDLAPGIGRRVARWRVIVGSGRGGLGRRSGRCARTAARQGLIDRLLPLADGRASVCGRRRGGASRGETAARRHLGLRRSGRRGCDRGLRARRDLEHQLFGLVALREAHPVGEHVGHQHPVDLVPLAHRARLAAGDFLEKRDTAVPRECRAGQDELATLYFFVAFGACRRRRRRAAGRIEQRAIDRFVQAGDAAFDLVFGQQRGCHRLGFDRLGCRRQLVQLAAPVGLDAQQREKRQRGRDPPQQCAKVSVHGLSASVLENAMTSSSTLTSGSTPGAGLNPLNAFSGRIVSPSMIRYGCCVSMA